MAPRTDDARASDFHTFLPETPQVAFSLAFAVAVSLLRCVIGFDGPVRASRVVFEAETTTPFTLAIPQ